VHRTLVKAAQKAERSIKERRLVLIPWRGSIENRPEGKKGWSDEQFMGPGIGGRDLALLCEFLVLAGRSRDGLWAGLGRRTGREGRGRRPAFPALLLLERTGEAKKARLRLPARGQKSKVPKGEEGLKTCADVCTKPSKIENQSSEFLIKKGGRKNRSSSAPD